MKKQICQNCGHKYTPLAYRRYGNKCPCCGSTEFRVVWTKYIPGVGEKIVVKDPISG
jgi:Zn finger protein HypA/HybF involved in hydrogenase expression